MDPTVVSGTIQEFSGTRYYQCGNYFQRRGIRLHRTVWEAANGPIPDGYHVHHIDGDRSNNQLKNLELKLGHDHLSEHMTPERREWARANIHKAIAAAPAWHSTPAGYALHSANGKKSGALMRARWQQTISKTSICYWCMELFQSKAGSYFCKPTCRTQAHKIGVTVSWLKKFGLKPLNPSMT